MKVKTLLFVGALAILSLGGSAQGVHADTATSTASLTIDSRKLTKAETRERDKEIAEAKAEEERWNNVEIESAGPTEVNEIHDGKTSHYWVDDNGKSYETNPVKSKPVSKRTKAEKKAEKKTEKRMSRPHRTVLETVHASLASIPSKLVKLFN